MKSFKEQCALVVDDQHIVTKLLMTIFSRLGFAEVLVAHDGEEALALLRTKPVDVVLSDIGMEPMGGLRLLAAMRREPRLATIPVLLTTGRPDPATLIAAKRLGAADILPKPFRPEVLRARLERL